MKNIYKYLLTVLLVSAAASLFAFGSDFVDVSRLQGQLQNTIEETVNERPLYSFVKQKFTNYYGWEDFADPNHESGWYRVDDFLKFIKDNEQDLQNADVTVSGRPIPLADLYNPENMGMEEYYYLFWTYLGARYISNIYGINSGFEKINLQIVTSNFNWGGTGNISIKANSGKAFPVLINTGIHETTHMLPFLKNEPNSTLSELATFYSVYNYGLPVKSEGAEFKDGIRDLRRTVERRPDINILKEYNYYLGGLVLNAQLDNKKVLSLKDTGVIYRASIGRFILNYIAMKNNMFFTETRGGGLWESLGIGYFNEEEAELINSNPNKLVYLGEKKLMTTNYKNLFVEYVNNQYKQNYSFYEGKNPISAQNYLQNMYGRDYNSGISKLYNKIYKLLPRDFVYEMNKDFPAQTNETFSSVGWDENETLAEYNKGITQAILNALEEMNIPESKIPKGYI